MQVRTGFILYHSMALGVCYRRVENTVSLFPGHTRFPPHPFGFHQHPERRRLPFLRHLPLFFIIVAVGQTNNNTSPSLQKLQYSSSPAQTIFNTPCKHKPYSTLQPCTDYIPIPLFIKVLAKLLSRSVSVSSVPLVPRIPRA